MIQVNLQRKRLATDELLLEAVKRGVAVALLQEPYVGGARAMRNHRGVRIFQSTGTGNGTVKAAIAVFDPDLTVIQYPNLTTNNITVVGVQTSAWRITLVSFYFEPDQPVGPYLEHLKRVEEEVGSRMWVAGGDANAKSTWWGSLSIDSRGEEVSGVLDELSLNILNRGEIPTFDTIRGGKRYCSHIDITACSTDILDLVDDWKVDEGLTSSDHNGISFNVKLRRSKGIKIVRTTRMFNTKKANWSEFREKLKQLMQQKNISKSEIEKLNKADQLNMTVNQYTQAIRDACTSSMPMKKSKEVLTLPWWSEKLERMKREVATRKNRIRCAGPTRRSKVVEDYLKKKIEYETEANKDIVESWKNFCAKQDREGVWEGIYRVIGRTKGRTEDQPLVKDDKVLDAKGSVELLAKTFYPEDSRDSDSAYHRLIREKANVVNAGEHNDSCDPPFTMTELMAACRSFNVKKAPGADGFTADICCHAIGSAPDVALALLNRCLKCHHFPEAWKEAIVIVLRKPGKEDYGNPKAYRPIGLLPILGKIFEKMLVTRLKFHLIPRMSTRQYGFMPQKSTEDSLYALMQHIRSKLELKKIVVLISLDIEGAFDSAWWPVIRVRLAEEKCPVGLRRVIDSYLENRMVRVRYAGEEFSRATNMGCVQGSIGGPIFWNLIVDPLLKSLEARDDYCQAFADDVVLVFDGDTAREVEGRANAALEHVRAWGVQNKLKFAPQKTNAMVITRKLKYDTPRLSMGGVGVAMSKEIKILGVTIDDKLTFNSHVANICRKAVGIYKQLTKAAKTSWGLHPEVIRMIYVATVEPVVLYAASVWAPAAGKLGVAKQLGTVQRGIAQKLCKAYRTVSLNSALVLAGILPLDLRVREAASLYEARRGVPQTALGDRRVEQPASAMEAPHPAERAELELVSLVNQEQLDAQSELEVRIFTDGSKIGGKVGAALSMWSGNAETKALKLALPHYCTVYQAELLAICVATREMLKHNARSFGVFSDSMAALQTIQNYDRHHPLAVEARANIKSLSIQNKTLTLFWIKAHVGLDGNERADELAKRAAEGSKRKPDYDLCPVSHVKRCIRTATLDEWNRRYGSGETASVTKLFFPDAVAAYRTIRKCKISNIVTQIMTGHGGFSEYLNRFKCKESPSCICDADVDETVPHILFSCPVFDKERLEAEKLLNSKLDAENLSQIIAGKNREILLEYCIKICKRVINRNKSA